MEERTQGIVLRALDYRENQRIITLFTPLGLISLIVKRIQRRSSHLLTLTSLFCEGEFLFKKGRSDLHAFIDGSVMDVHLPLREQLVSLQAAGGLGHALLASQFAGKVSSELYHLFRCYLKQIRTFSTPSTLIASFQLKLLAHDGLISLTPECNRCPNKASRCLAQGESLCADHHVEHSLCFSAEEWNQLLLLHGAKQLSVLRALNLSAPLLQKIDFFFTSRLC
jgi:DNA repair protein RecO (recombination protein O)